MYIEELKQEFMAVIEVKSQRNLPQKTPEQQLCCSGIVIGGRGGVPQIRQPRIRPTRKQATPNTSI